MLQQQFEKNQNQKVPQWLNQLRQEQFAFYQAQGLPTTHDENWKYTNIKPITKKEFSLGKLNVNFSPFSYTKDLTAINIFVVNGHFHSMFNTDVKGLTIKSLNIAIQEKNFFIKRLNQLAKTLQHGFATLNTAFINDGIYLHLDKNIHLDVPIHIFYINTDPESIQYIRNLFVIDPCAKATIIEHFLAEHNETYCTNSISEIFLDNAANLNHIKLQQETESAYHIGTTQVQQRRDSQFNSHVFSFGGKLSRSDTNIALIEEGSYCKQYGLYLGHARQHFDHHTYVGHEKPYCTSQQLYKGILAESARAVFNGKVYVHPHAVKTDSSQMNKNLLLSDKAEIDTKPELEIYNDDVKCSHGTTVGQLDESQIFYLLTRGIDRTTAKSLLMYAFCCELVNKIENKELNSFLINLVINQLPAGPTIKRLLQ